MPTPDSLFLSFLIGFVIAAALGAVCAAVTFKALDRTDRRNPRDN